MSDIHDKTAILKQRLNNSSWIYTFTCMVGAGIELIACVYTITYLAYRRFKGNETDKLPIIVKI